MVIKSLSTMTPYESVRYIGGQRRVVVIQPDLRKGERLVLLSHNPEADCDAPAAQARKQGISAFAVPVVVPNITEVPLLGTGRTDYVSARKLADELSPPVDQAC